MTLEAPDVDEQFIHTVVRAPNKRGASPVRSSSSLVKVILTPIARDELDVRLSTGRGRRFPAAAFEVKEAMKGGKTVLKVTPEAAHFIREELEHALDMLSDPHFADNPSMAYHRSGIEHALKGLKRLRKPLAASVPGPATTVRTMALEARAGLLKGGPLDLLAVWSLVAAAENVLLAKTGKCPESGCVVKRADKWRVVSNKTGDLWPQTYKTKQDAEDAIAAYHMRKKGIPPPA